MKHFPLGVAPLLLVIWRTALTIGLLVGLIALVVLGYQYPWTGFGEVATTDDKVTPAKTLWDWLDLLIVPIVLAVGAFLLDGSRRRGDQRVELDRQQQAVLDSFLDYVSEVILEGHLTDERTRDRARELIRTRTLAALRLLDGKRKAQVLQFLHESGLVGKEPIIQLNGADFTKAALDEATLQGAELRGVYFTCASFKSANLIGADLRGSDLSYVDFSDASLRDVRLVQANLRSARFRKADMNGADLRDTGLQEAQLTLRQRLQLKR